MQTFRDNNNQAHMNTVGDNGTVIVMRNQAGRWSPVALKVEFCLMPASS